ncbi:WhiB family transcriptional regulator [Streptomyces rubiginosohelvolus]|uniref:WhiB family transcriptional regulator n=1 Tax=Streptomyces rubiginosohelvolus TaxID=67362 RepID=UPI00382E5CD4
MTAPDLRGHASGHVRETRPRYDDEELTMPRPSKYAPDTRPRRPHWMDDAACFGAEATAFFPVGAKGVPAKIYALHAKSFCRRCPVRAECLEHALTFPEKYGVWGGLDEDERAELLRDARRAAERERRRAKLARDKAAEREAACANT